MAAYLSVGDGENVVYADDSNVWQLGRNVEEVARKLTAKASQFVNYTRSMGLAMNASATQLVFSANAGNVANVTVEVDGSTIKPTITIELLGVCYDKKLSTTPQVRSLLVAVRQRASVVARLANHLPRGTYLRLLSYGLVMGKFALALAAMARPRLDSEVAATGIWSKIQVALNDLARSLPGVRRRNHVPIPDLLDLAGIESANRMVVKAIAAETWSCYQSKDGQDGARNHVGSIFFSNNKTAQAKTTRSARTGKIMVPLRGVTPSSRTRPTCGTGRSRYAPRLQRRLQRKWRQIWLISHLSSHSFLRDLTSRLQLVGCSLQVVGRLLRDVGRLPGNVGRVLQDVGRKDQQTSPSRALIFLHPERVGKGRKESAAARNKQDLAGPERSKAQRRKIFVSAIKIKIVHE
jgi:hypothetical protein